MSMRALTLPNEHRNFYKSWFFFSYVSRNVWLKRTLRGGKSIIKNANFRKDLDWMEKTMKYKSYVSLLRTYSQFLFSHACKFSEPLKIHWIPQYAAYLSPPPAFLKKKIFFEFFFFFLKKIFLPKILKKPFLT